MEPYFPCSCIVWDSISETQIANLQKLQNRAAQIITGASYLQRSIVRGSPLAMLETSRGLGTNMFFLCTHVQY